MSAKHIFPLIEPKLLNSSNRWATTEEELKELYECEYTGAITIRTSLLEGFNHDDKIHQHCFLDSATGQLSSTGKAISSLNTLGYSPITLEEYIEIIKRIVKRSPRTPPKPVIFSVTGSAEEVSQCLKLLGSSPCQGYAMMEINLSCPNILNKPPPAYSITELKSYLTTLGNTASIPVGLKLPPYTHHDQFANVISALSSADIYPISFLTSTNTLGSSLILNPDTLEPVLSSASGTGIGGLAGAALHPLALGNVKTLRSMLDQSGLEHIKIIGTGGVSDSAGSKSMMAVGAYAVGVGTALGTDGVDVFKKILQE